MISLDNNLAERMIRGPVVLAAAPITCGAALRCHTLPSARGRASTFKSA
jgi:hypothetical protein